MNKLYQKNELFFAILWIVVYVIAFSAGDRFSASVGVEKSVTVLIGAVLTAVLVLWLRKNGLFAEYGLCPSKVAASKLLYYVPLKQALASKQFKSVYLDRLLSAQKKEK